VTLPAKSGLPENVRLAHEVLERHYRAPVMTPGQFCEKLSAYVRALREEGSDGPYSGEAAEALREYGQFIIAFASKSSLLGRLLYGGEDVRKRRCPIHNGQWVGVSCCPHGCDETGWLPNELKGCG
jgi:hypothetical protein